MSSPTCRFASEARAGLLCLAALSAATGAAPARAQPEEAPAAERAEEHRAAGYKAYDLGDYDAAIREFHRAYNLEPDPRVLYNLGLAYRRRYQLSADRADLVRARDAFTSFLSLVSVDDPRFPADRTWFEKVTSLAEKYRSEVEAELGRRDRGALPRRAPPRDRQEPAKRGRPTAALVFLGTAAAAGLAGGVTGTLAWRDGSRSSDRADEGDFAEANRLADRSDRLALTTDVLVGVAAVSATVGIVLWLRRSSSHSTVAAAPGRDTLGLAVSF